MSYKNKKRMMIFIIGFIIVLSSFIAYSDNFIIKNIGNIGFNDTNPEFTSIRVVILELNLTNASNCSYINGNYSNFTGSWPDPEECNDKTWVLTDFPGLKYVSLKVAYSDNSTQYYMDTIFYNYTGSGLDLTPPTNLNASYSRFTNSNNTLKVSFSDASDPESDILKIPLVYNYQIFINGTLNTTVLSYDSKKIEFTLDNNNSFSHNESTTVRITAVNSAGLNATFDANITIDFISPDDVSVNSSAAPSIWQNNRNVVFNVSSSDALSGIYGYSYTLSEDSSITPDDVPKSDDNGEFNFTSIAFENLQTINTGKYYFRIKARDLAGNFGNITTYRAYIDTKKPTKPEIISFEKIFGTNTTNSSWTQSYDYESGVSNYIVEFSNESDYSNIIFNATVSNSTFYYEFSNPSNYNDVYVRIKAVDMVGNEGQYSNEETNYDTTPPVITPVRPDGNVYNTLPTIALYTNEKAICYDGNDDKFLFTNDTFHETRPKSGGSPYFVKCLDMAGNEADASFTFSNAGAINPTLPGSVTGYAGKNTMFNITLGVGDVGKDNIKAYINGKESDFTLFDAGSENYVLGLDPIPTPGIYTVMVSGATNDTTSLTINPITLVADYTSTSSISPQPYKKMAYANYSDITIGIATDAANQTISYSSNIIGVESENNGKVYIFATGRGANMKSKEKLLENNAFSNQKNPSFGHFALEENTIKATLGYSNVDISGNEVLGTGSYSLLIKKLKNETKKTILVTSSISGYNDRGVRQYE